MSVSASDFKSMLNLMGELALIKGEIEGLRAENKCLREDRDSWKQVAMTALGETNG
jgi:hypothetical protein